MKLEPQKTGLGLGSLMALMHLMWSLLVSLGIAQTWMDWIFSIHFLNNPHSIQPFNIITALTLVVVTGLVGYAVGWIFATIWNYWQKK